VSDTQIHPTPDQLETLVEGGLAEAERATLERHLVTCERCRAEVEEWRALFTTLAALPQLAPSAGFADRVLAGVRSRPSWSTRAAAALARLQPRTTTGWALVAACLTLPAIVATALLAWVLTRPGLDLQTLAVFLRDRAADLVLSFAGDVATTAMETTIAVRIAALVERILAAGPTELGLAAAVFATMTFVSAWVLYRNLFRPSTRKVHHVSFHASFVV
jgi:anti-sigma factor RsiW